MDPGRDVSFTVDLEPDCLPFLGGYRGVDEGMPRLLDLLDELRIRATFFTTGDVARRSPRLIERIVAGGHELGSHSVTHPRFDQLSWQDARWEMEESARILREFAPVISFRAPYLRLPNAFLPLLADAGYEIDSSSARYKWKGGSTEAPGAIPRGVKQREGLPARAAASITSSALRLPRPIRHNLLRLLPDPLVLFVHPWEFVDLRGEALRWDCRAGTGDHALGCARETLTMLRDRGARFHRIADLPRLAG
jgi:peptidoglycan-N-acetylglucosamine deacetylase